MLVFLLLLSALISGSEVAFFSLSQKEIIICKKSDRGNLRRIAKLLKSPKQLLATILILNNLINVAIVTLSTYLSWELAGSKSTTGMLIIGLTIVVTAAIVFFGEVLPKIFANQNRLGFAKKTAGFITVANALFHPLSWLLMTFSKAVEHRIKKKSYDLSIDELNHALEITGKNSSDEEKEILKGIVNFSMLSVTQVMRSRLDITAFDITSDYHELMNGVNNCNYSRIPVFSDTVDNIEGILYVKDLLPYLESDEQFKWQKLLRPGYFVPESKKIDTLLRDFQEKRVHMAIVVDEYGGTSGLITLEDIIEEIVGEINDEFDDDDIAFNRLDDNTFVFEGKTSLHDFCKIIGEESTIFEEVKGESESLGGLLLELSSKFPRVGEKIYFDKFVFTVVSLDSRRIKRIRVLINPPLVSDKAS